MEKADDQSLQFACPKVSRIQRRFVSTHLRAPWKCGCLVTPFSRAALTPTRELQYARGDIIAAIEKFTDCLAQQTPDSQFFRELRQKLVHAAEGLLPDALPLGLTHRDFTPANVLVGSEGRVTMFDTQGRWHGPVYADLAQFLIALKVSWQHIFSAAGIAMRARAQRERDFLRDILKNPAPPALSDYSSACWSGWWVARPITATQLGEYDGLSAGRNCISAAVTSSDMCVT